MVKSTARAHPIIGRACPTSPGFQFTAHSIFWGKFSDVIRTD